MFSRSDRRKEKSQHNPSHPIPDQIKHKLIQDRLTKQLMRQSNIVKPTTDDIQIARDRVATELKRSDLEYQRQRDRALRRRSRLISRPSHKTQSASEIEESTEQANEGSGQSENG